LVEERAKKEQRVLQYQSQQEEMKMEKKGSKKKVKKTALSE